MSVTLSIIGYSAINITCNGQSGGGTTVPDTPDTPSTPKQVILQITPNLSALNYTCTGADTNPACNFAKWYPATSGTITSSTANAGVTFDLSSFKGWTLKIESLGAVNSSGTTTSTTYSYARMFLHKTMPSINDSSSNVKSTGWTGEGSSQGYSQRLNTTTTYNGTVPSQDTNAYLYLRTAYNTSATEFGAYKITLTEP